MKSCPFCGFNEGWIRESPWNIIENRNYKDTKYVVQCHVCNSIGPESKTRIGAEYKWDGYLKEENLILNKSLEENIGAPMSTLTNVPGMGNAVPPNSSTSNIGSGDNWNNTSPHQQTKRKKYLKRKRKIKMNLFILI